METFRDWWKINEERKYHDLFKRAKHRGSGFKANACLLSNCSFSNRSASSFQAYQRVCGTHRRDRKKPWNLPGLLGWNSPRHSVPACNCPGYAGQTRTQPENAPVALFVLHARCRLSVRPPILCPRRPSSKQELTASSETVSIMLPMFV